MAGSENNSDQIFNVQYFCPDTSTKWLVNQFESIRSSQGFTLEDKFLPRVDVAFVFHFKTLPLIFAPEAKRLPEIFLAPVLQKAHVLKAENELDTFVVSCKPSVLSRVFKLNLRKDKQLQLDLPMDVFLPLWEKLRDQQEDDSRIRIFGDFLTSLHPDPYQPDEIDRIYELIIQNVQNTSLNQLLSHRLRSVSTIQRSFTQRIGVCPKTLARIARLNYLWDVVDKNDGIALQDLVYFGNYFDQAHFINDFRKLTGETPGSFFERNLDISKMLSGK